MISVSAWCLLRRALQEAQEIFGIDFDFDEFEQFDEDEDEEDVEDDVIVFCLLLHILP